MVEEKSYKKKSYKKKSYKKKSYKKKSYKEVLREVSFKHYINCFEEWLREVL